MNSTEPLSTIKPPTKPNSALMKKERILITGAGGVLGTALYSILNSQPAQTIMAIRRDNCDLLNKESTESLFLDFRPTLVYHLAGRVAGIQGNLEFGGLAYYENTLINLNVVEACKKVGVRKIVAASTAAVYSDNAQLPMREDYLWNGPPHFSERPYAQAKRSLLAQLEAYSQQYGLDFSYLICTNLYGINDRFDTLHGHVVPSLIARFYEAVNISSPYITIWGDGSPTRDFLFSEDAANGFIAASSASSGSFNLASGTSVSISSLVNTLISISGYKGDILWDPGKPNGQLRREYDISAISKLGWKATTSLEEGLRKTWNWYSENIEQIRR